MRDGLLQTTVSPWGAGEGSALFQKSPAPQQTADRAYSVNTAVGQLGLTDLIHDASSVLAARVKLSFYMLQA